MQLIQTIYMFFIIMGFNIISMFFIVKLYAYNHDFLPRKGIDWNKRLKEDLFIFGGCIFVVAGIVLSIIALTFWGDTGFGPLIPEKIMRMTIPAVALIAIGIQSLFAGFIMSIVKVKAK